MVETKYGKLPDEVIISYLGYLVGKVYKLLPLKDYEDKNLYKYMYSLQRELIGNKELIEQLKNDGNFLSILAKIEFLLNNHDVSQRVYRKDILDSVVLVKKIKENYENIKEGE